jgi:hypothetical protein
VRLREQAGSDLSASFSVFAISIKSWRLPVSGSWPA